MVVVVKCCFMFIQKWFKINLNLVLLCGDRMLLSLLIWTALFWDIELVGLFRYSLTALSFPPGPSFSPSQKNSSEGEIFFSFWFFLLGWKKLENGWKRVLVIGYMSEKEFLTMSIHDMISWSFRWIHLYRNLPWYIAWRLEIGLEKEKTTTKKGSANVS